MMNRPFLMALFVGLLLVPCTNGFAAEPTTDVVLGEKLVRKIFANANARDIDALKKFIANGFQSVHQDGARNRDEEIKLLKGLNLGDYTLANFKVTRNGPALVVTYTVAAAETLAGKRVSKTPAPRLTVFLKTDIGWQWTAHASLKGFNDR